MTVTTEQASPENGIIWPTAGGIYETDIYNVHSGGSQISENYSTFYLVNPPKMKYMNIDFLTYTASAKNVFTIKF